MTVGKKLKVARVFNFCVNLYISRRWYVCGTSEIQSLGEEGCGVCAAILWGESVLPLYLDTISHK